MQIYLKDCFSYNWYYTIFVILKGIDKVGLRFIKLVFKM